MNPPQPLIFCSFLLDPPHVDARLIAESMHPTLGPIWVFRGPLGGTGPTVVATYCLNECRQSTLAALDDLSHYLARQPAASPGHVHASCLDVVAAVLASASPDEIADALAEATCPDARTALLIELSRRST